MKTLALLFGLWLLLPGIIRAQLKPIPDKMLGKVQENRTETACDGEQQEIYQLLESGKPLMIIYDGHNCINCKKAAPVVAEYIEKNHNRVNFWAPLMKMIVPVNCNEVRQWEEWFPGFEHAFSFPVDHSYYHDYYGTSFNLPFFIVIDPATRKVRFAAGNDNYPGGAREAFAEAVKVTESLLPEIAGGRKIHFEKDYLLLNRPVVHPDSLSEANFDFYNFSDTTSQFRWELDRTNMPLGWLSVLCDPMGCRDPKLTESQFITKPGAKSHFGLTVFHKGMPGLGSATIEAYPNGDQSLAAMTQVAFIHYLPEPSQGDEHSRSRLYGDVTLKLTLSDSREQEIAVLLEDQLKNLPETLLHLKEGKLWVKEKPFESEIETGMEINLNYYLMNSLVKQDKLFRLPDGTFQARK